MQLWTNFARSGDPSAEDLEWKPYDKRARNSMVISENPHLSKDVLRMQRKLLSPLLPRMINPSYTELNFNVPFVRKALTGSLIALAGLTATAYFAARLLDN